MSRILELLAWIDPSKAKIAVVVGLVAGIVLSSFLSNDDNRASGMERTQAAASEAGAPLPAAEAAESVSEAAGPGFACRASRRPLPWVPASPGGPGKGRVHNFGPALPLKAAQVAANQ